MGGGLLGYVANCLASSCFKLTNCADAVPNSDDVIRYLLGWACPPKPAFLKFSTTASVRKMTFTHQVFQDITLPMTDLEKSIDLSEEVFDTYPVLVYPCRVYDHKIGSVVLQTNHTPPYPTGI